MTPSGDSDIMAQTKELADDARGLVRRLAESGIVPKEAIPGWVGGAIVTALVEELSDLDKGNSE